MNHKLKFVLVALVVAAGVILFNGCATSSDMASEASGEKLWAQNCLRCHNNRGPSTYSPAQWDVSMLHRRIHGNLTAVEHKKILEFLQSN